MARRGDYFYTTATTVFYVTASIVPFDGVMSPSYRMPREWPGDVPVCPATPLPFRWGPHGSLYLLLGMIGVYGAAVALILWVI